MSGEVPDDWREAPFSALASYDNGRAFKPTDWGSEGLPIVRIAQITNPKANTNRYSGVVDSRHLLNDGDLIFSWSATLAVMKWTRGPAVLNQHLFKVTPAVGIDQDWLQFRLDASIPDMTEEAHGTTMKHIRKGTLASQTTIVPPLDEQQRIAEVLRSVDEALAGNRAVLAAAAETLDLLSDELLVANAQRVGEMVRFGDLIDTLEAGVSVNSEGRHAEPDEVGILKTSCVSAGHFEPEEHKAVLASERARVRVPVRGDSIIISRMNTFELVGANAFVEADHGDLFLPDRLWLLKSNSRVRIRWLAFYMKTAKFREQVISIATGTSGSMKNISKGRLNDLVVFIPDDQQQAHDIAVLAAVEAVLLSARKIEARQRVAAIALKSDLLSGRVRVPA